MIASLNPITTETLKNAFPIKDKLHFNFLTCVCCNEILKKTLEENGQVHVRDCSLLLPLARGWLHMHRLNQVIIMLSKFIEHDDDCSIFTKCNSNSSDCQNHIHILKNGY